MIKSLSIKNFKKIKDQTFSFSDFDLIIGHNNSGKSTVLQALGIWQFCVDEFLRSKRGGKTGIQIVLPNFTALPVPEFNLLWHDRTDRQYPQVNGAKKQEFIFIEIDVKWNSHDGNEWCFGVSLRYQTPQSLYAIPKGGWDKFRSIADADVLPKLVYVPPFSGLEPTEIWFDDGILRKNVGKAQPGSVLRNLLFRVVDKDQTPIEDNEDWQKIVRHIKQWFGITINPPEYIKGVSTEIKVTYRTNSGKDFDIIAGGSGFHQVLTLLAFIYGYPGLTTILFDEPDAHMHVRLQREVLQYFSEQTQIQFVIATHAEEFIRGLNVANILSVMAPEPRRIESISPIISALSEVSNMSVMSVIQSPFILYVEGEDDERILRAWGGVLGKSDVLGRFHIETMGGTDKDTMKEWAQAHFNGLRQIVPEVKRVVLFDYDDDGSFHPAPDNEVLFEWSRRNIENYLLVPNAWQRAILDAFNEEAPNLLTQPYEGIIQAYFSEENLNLPPNQNWQNVRANIFKVVDGKSILFRGENSLFQRIRKHEPGEEIILNRERVARNMLETELHQDVHRFFQKLESLLHSHSQLEK